MLHRRRLGRPQQRPDHDQGRRPADRAGRRRRPAHRARRLRRRRRPGLGRPPTSRSALTHAPDRGCWTRWPPTASAAARRAHPRRPGLRTRLRRAGHQLRPAPARWRKGLHRWPGSDSWLHVSAGLGTHPTAPVRFACRARSHPADARSPADRRPTGAPPARPAGVPNLTLGAVGYYCSARLGVWRSLVARFVRDEEVVGSNPATPTEVRGHIRSMDVPSSASWVTNCGRIEASQGCDPAEARRTVAASGAVPTVEGRSARA